MKQQSWASRLTKSLAVACVLAAAASTASAAGTFYTTESSYLANTNPNYYLENFSSFTFGSPLDGTQTTYAAPGANGFGWTASAALGLYSNVSALSTNSANDPIMILFGGSPVTSFGGIFANTDISGAIIPGTVTITTSAGDTMTVNTNTFLGFTSATPFTSITMSAAGTTSNWVQVDHFYTGAAVPEPGTVGLLVVGAAGIAGAAIKRRRSA
jgi:hypothetical protein